MITSQFFQLTPFNKKIFLIKKRENVIILKLRYKETNEFVRMCLRQTASIIQ